MKDPRFENVGSDELASLRSLLRKAAYAVKYRVKRGKRGVRLGDVAVELGISETLWDLMMRVSPSSGSKVWEEELERVGLTTDDGRLG